MSNPGSNAGKTLVVVATYNEIENLPPLVDEIFRYLPAADLLVVDDNSPDGTGRWCDDRAAEDPRLHCLHRAGKLGLGTAVIAAMKYALANGYGYVLTMDADFSHPPKCLPAMIAGMNPENGSSVDVMIGSRYIPGGGVEGWPLKRHFMSRGVNFYARWFLGLKPKDCSGNYRCYRTEILAKLDFDQRPQPGILAAGRDPLASEARGRAVRRNADRVRRSPARQIEDQSERGGQRLADHLLAGHAEPAGTRRA